MKQAIAEAKRLGACDKSVKIAEKGEYEAGEELKKNMGWAIQEGFPSLPVLRLYNFERNGIYIDKEIVQRNSLFLMLAGQSVARLEYSNYTVADLYVRDDSKVDIVVKDGAFVLVRVMGGEVNIKTEGGRVTVSQYGGKVNGDENVKIKKRWQAK